VNLTAGSSLADLAFPLMPSDPDRHGVVVEAGRRWSFDAVPGGADWMVWGRLPDRSSIGDAARRAVDRRRALRTLPGCIPAGWRIAAVHSLPPRSLRAPGFRTRSASAIRTGALVELTATGDGHRILDAVATAAGALRPPARVHLGVGGAMVVPLTLVDGTAAVLRVGRSGTSGDPSVTVTTLERLAVAGVVHAPTLLARGSTLGTAWLTETAMPGHRPRRLTPELALQVAGACGRFPLGEGPPTAVTEDLAGIAGHLPDRAAAVARLGASLESRLERWPGVLNHGDLWTGNLLVDSGRLSAILDWDAAHPAAVPGADLVHLFAVEALSRHNTRLGTTFLDRPWRSAEFHRASAPYWDALSLRPDADLLDLAGLAWWAAAINGTLRRAPARRHDRRWLSANVDPVLEAASA
jgi:hypothetical protein